jgi:flagellar biosynthesis GTPase FlhF
MKESEVRFCLIDPLIKGLHNLTDIRVKLEESVKESEKSDSVNVSNRSVPDYSVYVLYYEHKPVKVFFLEAKTSKSVSLHSVCQTIGYYMASQTIHKRDEEIYPPLSVVITEKSVRLVFFPYYTSSGEPCIDAAVSSSMELFTNQEPKGFIALLTFITSYILLVSKQERPVSIIIDSEHDLHVKTVCKDYVLPEEVYLQSVLEQKEQQLQQKEQEKQQLLQQKEQKEQQLQQKEQEKQQLLQQKEQEKQQLLQQKEQEKQQLLQQKEQELKQLAVTLGMSIEELKEKMAGVTEPSSKRTKLN